MAKKAFRAQVDALTDAVNVAVDGSKGNVKTLTVAGNRTIDAPSNVRAGEHYIFIITNGSGGANTTAFAAAYKTAGAWVNPANGLARSIEFMAVSATSLIEVARAAADITP